MFERFRKLIQAELNLPASPHASFWHHLGGLIVFLLFIEILSGILLMVYYRPSVEEAYESVHYVMNEVKLGWFIRGIHRWGADLLILVLLAHLLRVYFQGAYRERELNWAIGVLLLLLVGAFAFTGALLPWDQTAFWGTEAVRKIIEHVPVFGKLFLDFLWGGHELEAGALLRLYVFHVGLLPWLTIALVLAHLYLLSRQGLYRAHANAANVQRTYRDWLLENLIGVLLLFGVLLTLAVAATPALSHRADPLQPVSPQTPWYFLPVTGLLQLIPDNWSLLAMGLGMLGLFLVPLLRARWMSLGVGGLGAAIVILLGILGYWRGGLR